MESGILGLGMRNTGVGIGIPLTIRIRNPSSTEKDLESSKWNPEECLGFPYMGRNASHGNDFRRLVTSPARSVESFALATLISVHLIDHSVAKAQLLHLL